jgi:hypothetical protein
MWAGRLPRDILIAAARYRLGCDAVIQVKTDPEALTATVP